jgi:glycerol-3-phosphate acyltransferase PlsX
MRVASRLVRDGIAQGFVSAGNTGALMATAKMVQGVVPGVERPALAGIFPTLIGPPVVVIDVGANVDCSPRMLAQFAIMGQLYYRAVWFQGQARVSAREASGLPNTSSPTRDKPVCMNCTASC